MQIPSTNTTQLLVPKTGYGALHYKFQIGSNHFISLSSTFGMVMPGRSISSASYRYGFNGKEKDDKVKGDGNSYDFGARLYDPRIGRWLSVDPDASLYPGITPYNFALNIPTRMVDKDGENATISIDYSTNTVTMSTTIFLVGKNANLEAAKNLQNLWNSGQTSFKVNDPNNPEVVWTVKVDMNFVYDQVVANAASNSGVDNWENGQTRSQDPTLNSEVGIGPGDNLLIMLDEVGDSYIEGESSQGGNIGAAQGVNGTSIHESLHFLGMDERYFKTEKGALEVVGLESDWMSTNGSTLLPFHAVDVLDYAIKQSNGQSMTFSTGSTTSEEVTTETYNPQTRMYHQQTTSITNSFQIDNTNHGKAPTIGVESNNARVIK